MLPEITDGNREQIRVYAQRKIEAMQRLLDGSATQDEISQALWEIRKEELALYEKSPEHAKQQQVTESRIRRLQRRIVERSKDKKKP